MGSYSKEFQYFTIVICFNAYSHSVHPFFECDINGKNYEQNMTIFDPKLSLKCD